MNNITINLYINNFHKLKKSKFRLKNKLIKQKFLYKDCIISDINDNKNQWIYLNYLKK